MNVRAIEVMNEKMSRRLNIRVIYSKTMMSDSLSFEEYISYAAHPQPSILTFLFLQAYNC